MMLIIAGLAIERKDFEIEIIARNRELSLLQAERTHRSTAAVLFERARFNLSSMQTAYTLITLS